MLYYDFWSTNKSNHWHFSSKRDQMANNYRKTGWINIEKQILKKSLQSLVKTYIFFYTFTIKYLFFYKNIK